MDGLCNCTNHCEIGKGCGTLDGKCKKITIAVFQSGCIIITGAQNHDQIKKAYAFICDVLLKHQESVEKKILANPEVNIVRKKHMINKRNIVM
jgi:TATA-box binding protein (TBP) (component of TFIID and TFIIIB)